MSPMNEISMRDAFVVFFATMGPLRAMGPFGDAMEQIPPEFRRRMAWKGTLVAAVVVILVALISEGFLEELRISVAAVVTAGGFILLLDALRTLEGKTLQIPPVRPVDCGSALRPWAVACYPITVPIIVSAPGIVAIFGFVAITGADWRQMGVVLETLLLVMALNLIVLLTAGTRSSAAPRPMLKLMAWIMAALQATEAMQYLLNGLGRSGLFPASST